MITNTTTSVLSALEWRYATKKYDASKKISDHEVEILIESARLAPSSYGLQPFVLLNIENKEVRERLKAASFNQSGVTDASHFFVFAAQQTMNRELVEAYMERIALSRQLSREQVNGFGEYILKTIETRSPEDIMNWNMKQTYIALGMMLHSAAELQIDSTPMEGFQREAYDEILGLQPHGLTASVAIAAGYRALDDAQQLLKKVRKSKQEFVWTI